MLGGALWSTGAPSHADCPMRSLYVSIPLPDTPALPMPPPSGSLFASLHASFCACPACFPPRLPPCPTLLLCQAMCCRSLSSSSSASVWGCSSGGPKNAPNRAEFPSRDCFHASWQIHEHARRVGQRHLRPLRPERTCRRDSSEHLAVSMSRLCLPLLCCPSYACGSLELR